MYTCEVHYLLIVHFSFKIGSIPCKSFSSITLDFVRNRILGILILFLFLFFFQWQIKTTFLKSTNFITQSRITLTTHVNHWSSNPPSHSLYLAALKIGYFSPAQLPRKSSNAKSFKAMPPNPLAFA